MAQLLPPRDLLQQVQGLESGIRRGRTASVAGVVLAAVQITILVANSAWLQALISLDWNAVLDQWPLLICLFVLVLSVLAIVWTRFWVHESRQPFRYTYSIAPFEPVTGDPEQALLTPIHVDLRERLSLRIRRLSLYQEGESADPVRPAPAAGAEAARLESHIHISGSYAVRRRPPDQRWFAEVTAWVRVGGPDRPATLAQPVVRYALTPADERPPARDPGFPPGINREQYEDILERTYFSVATEVYRQIKLDVGRKIELLPYRWFRASALFHEAEDYAQSNTLDAYDEARELFAAAQALYDPAATVLPDSRIRRPAAAAVLRLRLMLAAARRGASRVFPRLGRPEVLAARAQIGYATALLDTSVLAALSGLRSRAIYEAAPVVKRAVRRLERLTADVPGRDASLFDAWVTEAYASAMLEAMTAGRQALEKAHAADPLRLDQEARSVFVRALLADRMLSRISLYERAVELEPRFEAAQFQLALWSELLWRTRPTLERSVAKTIVAEYEKVLKLNPGNVAAWANTAYMSWLMEELPSARRRFEAGRRYKEIRQQAYVAEVDYGLARIAAENGEFVEAYDRYIQAVSAMLSQGWAQGSFTGYHFEYFSPHMLTRFRSYRDSVVRHHEHPSSEALRETTARVRDSVLAFVLFDFAQACLYYYRRTHDYTILNEGYEDCKRAIEVNERFVLPLYLRFQIECELREFATNAEPEGRWLDEVERLEPAWPEAALALLTWYDEEASRLRREADDADAAGHELESQANDREARLRRTAARTGYGSGGDVPTTYADPRTLLVQSESRFREARRLRAEAEARDKRARELPRKLLPHRWLWRDEPGDVNWKVVRDRQIVRELRWERSFEEFHVNALFAWCKFISDKSEGERLDELLDLIEERFLPSNIDLLELRRERAARNGDAPSRRPRLRRLPPPRTAADYRQRMDDVVTMWLASEGSTFVALSWLDPGSDHACDAFAQAVERKDLSPYLYHWLGRKLLGRWRLTHEERAREAALLAFERAVDIAQPDALVELADALVELEGPDRRRELYAKAGSSPAVGPHLLQDLAQRFGALGSYEEMLQVAERAKHADRVDPPIRAPEDHDATIARALLSLGQFADARRHLEAVPADGGLLGPAWRAGLADWLGSTGTEAARARFRDWVGASQRAALTDGNEAAAEDAASAALDLARLDGRSLWRPLGDAEAELMTRFPIAVPIALEAARAFFPQEGETPVVARMIEEDIPQIRQDIQFDTGVFVPGFRLRTSADLPDRGFRILIHDVVVVEATVPPGVEDDHLHMLAAAATAIRGRLWTFIDLQAVDTMLDDWRRRDEEVRAPIVDAIMPTTAHRCAFVHLLARLVQDGVPIDLDVVVDACRERDLRVTDLVAIAEAVRGRLVSRLVGKQARPVAIPPELEARMAEFIPSPGGGPRSSMTPDVAATFVGALQQLRTREDEVFVVSSPPLRRLVHDILALDPPAVLVLSRQEWAPSSSTVVSALAALNPFR